MLAIAILFTNHPATPQTRQLSAHTSSQTAVVHSLRSGISWQRSATWRWQDRAGITRTPTVHAERRTASIPFLRWIDRLWRGRRVKAHRLAVRKAARPAIAHLALWLCIHRGEGNSHPYPGHPYSGPLQMRSGWAGYPVSDWSEVPVVEVYADAEAQFRIHARRGDLGYWLAQQWPNTSLPCLGYA